MPKWFFFLWLFGQRRCVDCKALRWIHERDSSVCALRLRFQSFICMAQPLHVAWNSIDFEYDDRLQLEMCKNIEKFEEFNTASHRWKESNGWMFSTGDWFIRTASLRYVSHLVDIERITIRSMYSYVDVVDGIATRLAKLNKLKFLRLCCGELGLTSLIVELSASQSLEELVLNVHLHLDASETNFVEGLDQFQNLKTCEIRYIWHTAFINLARMRSRVSHLRHEIRTFDVMKKHYENYCRVSYRRTSEYSNR